MCVLVSFYGYSVFRHLLFRNNYVQCSTYAFSIGFIPRPPLVAICANTMHPCAAEGKNSRTACSKSRLTYQIHSCYTNARQWVWQTLRRKLSTCLLRRGLPPPPAGSPHHSKVNARRQGTYIPWNGREAAAVKVRQKMPELLEEGTANLAARCSEIHAVRFRFIAVQLCGVILATTDPYMAKLCVKRSNTESSKFSGEMPARKQQQSARDKKPKAAAQSDDHSACAEQFWTSAVSEEEVQLRVHVAGN